MLKVELTDKVQIQLSTTAKSYVFKKIIFNYSGALEQGTEHLNVGVICENEA